MKVTTTKNVVARFLKTAFNKLTKNLVKLVYLSYLQRLFFILCF